MYTLLPHSFYHTILQAGLDLVCHTHETMSMTVLALTFASAIGLSLIDFMKVAFRYSFRCRRVEGVQWSYIP